MLKARVFTETRREVRTEEYVAAGVVKEPSIIFPI